MPPIKTLPILERWECAGCARCCRGSLIRLDEEDLRKLREQGWESDPDIRGVATVIRAGWLSGSYRLAQRPDGSCVFLTASGRCRIHEKFGADAKPLMCRMFPLQLVPQEKSAVLTVRRACPTAAADQGPEVSTYRSLAGQLAEEAKLLTQPRRAPATTRSLPPAWDTHHVVARSVEGLVTAPNLPLVRRLVHAIRFCGMLEQCQLKGFTADKLTELCDLLAVEACDAGDLFRERIAPPAAAMTLFRQAAAEYLRLHPTFVPRESWLERWRMARAAVAFALGKGTVPRLHPGLAETTFEALERPLGHLEEAVQRPFARFFESHVRSAQYVLVSRPGWTLIQSFRALALSYPIGLWLLRMCCPDRTPTAADAIDIVTILDRGQGYAPLTSGNHRSRVAMLSRLGAIEQLAAWYAR